MGVLNDFDTAELVYRDYAGSAARREWFGIEQFSIALDKDRTSERKIY